MSGFKKSLITCGIFIFLAVFLTPLDGYSQKKSKSQLEKEKKENLTKIQEVERILKQTASEKQATLGQLNALNRQLEVRQEMIRTINKELDLLREEIGEIEILLEALESDLDNLKKEYSMMLYSAQKARHNNSRLAYLFSASTFRQFYMRLKYMEQYGVARRKQADKIKLVQKTLASQQNTIVAKTEEKNDLLNEQIQENANMMALRNKQNTVVGQLSRQEDKLRKEVAERKKAVQRLETLIAEIVKEEMAKKKNAVASSASESRALSASFANNKKRLPWPVSSGFISGRFGKQPHPVLKGITIENQGVDIQTNKGEPVRAVFNGKVTKVAYVPGMGSIVILQHGDYYTVYAKLKTANVKTGETVSTNQAIGEVYTDRDGVSEVQFQVWKNNSNLNPQDWLNAK
ncbi:murein hydrolase activator EnvC [Roseivirga sp. BDSF3-8]|uniref:murein hydrolase activator EnvC family protein n=1 Tax=Roseivirga sp. BDSF3-8 TaxID=3241598 RepID=UPI003531B6D5